MGYAQQAINAVGDEALDSTEFTTGGSYLIELTNSAGNTFIAEASEDFSSPMNWYTVPVVPLVTSNPPPDPQTYFTGDGLYVAQVTNCVNFRVRCTSFTGSTTDLVFNSGGVPSPPVSINSYLKSPLDGSGNVKVSQQGSITATVSGNVGINGTPNVNATISGTPSVNAAITAPVDGSGNVKTAPQNLPTDGSGNLKVAIQSGSSGLSAAKYQLVSASGTTNISASTLYGVYNPSGASLLSSATVKDGSNTILPNNTILSAAPFSATFGPAGITIGSGTIAVTLGGLLTNSLLVVFR